MKKIFLILPIMAIAACAQRPAQDLTLHCIKSDATDIQKSINAKFYDDKIIITDNSQKTEFSRFMEANNYQKSESTLFYLTPENGDMIHVKVDLNNKSMGTVWLIQKDKTPSENWFCETEYLHTPDPDFDVCAKDNKVMPEMVDVARPMYCKDKK